MTAFYMTGVGIYFCFLNVSLERRNKRSGLPQVCIFENNGLNFQKKVRPTTIIITLSRAWLNIFYSLLVIVRLKSMLLRFVNVLIFFFDQLLSFLVWFLGIVNWQVAYKTENLERGFCRIISVVIARQYTCNCVCYRT